MCCGFPPPPPYHLNRCCFPRVPLIHTQAPCTHMEAHTSCCYLREHAVDGSIVISMGLAFRSAICCFLHLIIASILALHPIRSCATFVQSVPRHCATACSHWDPSSFFRFRSHSIFSAHRCDVFHAADPLLTAAPHGRTTRSSWRNTFRRHVGICV